MQGNHRGQLFRQRRPTDSDGGSRSGGSCGHGNSGVNIRAVAVLGGEQRTAAAAAEHHRGAYAAGPHKWMDRRCSDASSSKCAAAAGIIVLAPRVHGINTGGGRAHRPTAVHFSAGSGGALAVRWRRGILLHGCPSPKHIGRVYNVWLRQVALIVILRPPSPPSSLHHQGRWVIFAGSR